ncbi:MAG: hypothetical protein KKB79_02185 [Nanoarchaeota archaeon]|nr:hypothetical protein [Nanoarchaeota archaeon]
MEECYPLPGRRVRLKGVSFFIHGIVHENPLVFISDEFKRDLAERFREYSTICEDGIASWIPNAESFNEIGNFNLNRITFLDYANLLKDYFYNRFITRTHKSPLATKAKSLRNVEDLIPIRKELIDSYPREPQGMNLLIERGCGGTLENPRGELPLRVRRYIYESKRSLDYAREKGLEELHIIVGCAHELPLEYLLIKNEIFK